MARCLSSRCAGPPPAGRLSLPACRVPVPDWTWSRGAAPGAVCDGVFGLLARFTWPLAIMEAAADQAIAACGGDAREAVKVLIVATHF